MDVPTVRKKCSSDREKLLIFEAEDLANSFSCCYRFPKNCQTWLEITKASFGFQNAQKLMK